MFDGFIPPFFPQLPRHRPGIVGIERSIEQRNKETNKNISLAFEDLSKLMEKVEILSLCDVEVCVCVCVC